MIAFATALKANSAVKSLNLGRPLLHSQQVIKNIDYQQVHFMNFHSGDILSYHNCWPGQLHSCHQFLSKIDH